ncbi:MAG: hypothetical protein KBT19_05055 [Lachnospiraceae bacterium]|nr:hypothetical protein [Candidatus Colinaster equi]
MRIKGKNEEKNSAKKSPVLIAILIFLLLAVIVFVSILFIKRPPVETSNESAISEYTRIAVEFGFILLFGTATFLYLKKKNSE